MLPPSLALAPTPALLAAPTDLDGLVSPATGQPVTLAQLAVPAGVLSCELQACAQPSFMHSSPEGACFVMLSSRESEYSQRMPCFCAGWRPRRTGNP